jgi:hypothetical protein
MRNFFGTKETGKRFVRIVTTRNLDGSKLMRSAVSNLALVLLAVSPAFSADRVWWGNSSGAEKDWNTAANWVGGVPTAGDNVFIPVGSADIDTGLDQSGVSLGTVLIEPGYTGNIGTYTGSSPAYLQIDCTQLTSYGTGRLYLDLCHTGAVDVLIGAATAATNTGYYGTYITTDGTGTIGQLSVSSGYVALGVFADDPAQTCAELRLQGPSCYVTVGKGVTATNVDSRGTLFLLTNNTVSTLEITGGLTTVGGSGGVTSATVEAGALRHFGSGTVTSCTVSGGTLDTTGAHYDHTITALTIEAGAVTLDPETTSVGTLNVTPNSPHTISVSKQ